MFKRVTYYLIGLFALAFGIVLNTRTGLGMAAIASFPYVINQVVGISLGTATMYMYLILVVVQIILLKKADIKILLQIPLSFVFGQIIDFINQLVTLKAENLVASYAILLFAIIIISFGVVLYVKMDLVNNPVDGTVKTISEVFKLPFGKTKLMYDIIFLSLSIGISLIFTGGIIGLGMGTVLSALLIGNTITFFNKRLSPYLARVVA